MHIAAAANVKQRLIPAVAALRDAIFVTMSPASIGSECGSLPPSAAGKRLAPDHGELFDAEQEARCPLIDTMARITISTDVITDEFGNPIVDALKEFLVVAKLVVLAPSLEDAIDPLQSGDQKEGLVETLAAA